MKCPEILCGREIFFLLVFLPRLLLLSFVLPGQLSLGVDEVEDHHPHHEDDDDVLTLPRHVFGHPRVEGCLDSFNLLPDIVYKAHSGVFWQSEIFLALLKVNVRKNKTSVTYFNML